MKSTFKDMRLKSPAAAVVAVLLIAVIAACLIIKIAMPARPALEKNVPALPGAAAGKNAERRVYVCPTMCIPPVAKPGTCPICGMQLVAVSGADAGGSKAVPRIRLSEEAVKLAEIQVAAVERKAVAAEITAFGQIAYDPFWVSKVTALTSGIISKEYLARAGVLVTFGDPLFEIYSYEIYFTQQELLDAVKAVPGFFPLPPAPTAPGSAREKLVQEPLLQTKKAAKESKTAGISTEADRKKVTLLLQKLGSLGLTKQDLDLFMRKREPTGTATVYARLNGLVTDKKASLGSFVTIGTPLCVITDPRYLWLKLSIYEADLPWLRIRQEVEFQAEAYPGELFKGRLEFIEPIFNKESRTFEIGVKCPDTGGKLRAGMAVRAIIRAALAAGVVIGPGAGLEMQAPLVIPDTAPLVTGRRAVVYVAVPGERGMFEGREVVLGPRAKNYYVIKEGLREGEQVVVNGSFKIDSALQILAKPSMINSIETDQVRMQIPAADSATVNAAPVAAQKK